MVFELYRELIKEELDYNIKVAEMPMGDALEHAFKQLSILDNKEINEQIKKYRETKNKLIDELNKTSEDINNLVTKYYDGLVKKL